MRDKPDFALLLYGHKALNILIMRFESINVILFS